eukprot:CAMPEP_0168314964 /NCGR_PEP_ID=MMETSP0210-20121227/9782_1 /TAXON_ID=40633 /ORGANISM="Condylostoma magnum, Strain COL2" /LENGTH=39 /DNA_ID= /DNA_START= /DNA_END= /DNA_ORIENTATION=
MIEIEEYDNNSDDDLDMDLEVSYGCNPEDDRFDSVIGIL